LKSASLTSSDHSYSGSGPSSFCSFLTGIVGGGIFFVFDFFESMLSDLGAVVDFCIDAVSGL
jgi:hypothetical protein